MSDICEIQDSLQIVHRQLADQLLYRYSNRDTEEVEIHTLPHNTSSNSFNMVSQEVATGYSCCCLSYVPDCLPVILSSCMEEITLALLTALVMSCTVRSATAAAVSASISTPVTPSQRTHTVTPTRLKAAHTSKDTATWVMRARIWQRGMS